MRIIFMGTPDFSVPALSELLASGHEILAVYTQPPKPAGRGHKLRPSPIQAFAETHGIEVRCPVHFKHAQTRDAFHALQADIAIVVAYGLILPPSILAMPQYGCLNLHGSKLPRWRGAAPIQRAIMAGDQESAVQVMQMEQGLDTGAILLSETVPILPTDTAGSLHDKLAHTGAGLLPRALAALERGGLVPVPQSDQGITYAAKLTNEETRLNWHHPAQHLDYQIRGLSPFPGAWFELPDKEGKPVRLKALFSKQSSTPSDAPAGTVLNLDQGLTIACQEGAITITRVQRAGKGIQEIEAFLRGFPLKTGQVLL